MTSAEFARKYNLLKCVSEHGARTYLAEQKGLARGRIVMVHYLDVGSSSETKQLVERLGTITTDAMDKVVEATDVDGVPVVVTFFISDFQSLPAWLDQHTDRSPSRQAGNFTSIFGAPSAPAPAQPAAPVQLPKKEAGDFTRIFGSPSKPSTPDDAAATLIMPAMSPPPPPPQKAPSDFTSIFGSAGATAGVPIPPPSPVPQPRPQPTRPRASEFTSIFGKVADERPLGVPQPNLDAVAPLAPLPPEPAPPTPEPRGEGFTQLFQRLATPGAGSPTQSSGMPVASGPASAGGAMPPFPSAPPSPPPPPSAASGGSEFTRMLGRVTPDDAHSARMAGGGAVVPPSSRGISEVMPRVAPPVAPGLSAPPPPPMPQWQAPAAPQPPKVERPPAEPSAVTTAASKNKLILVIGINVALLLVLGIVLYFVLN